MEIKLNRLEIEEAIFRYVSKTRRVDYTELVVDHTCVLDGSVHTTNRMVVSGVHSNLNDVTITVQKRIKFNPIVIRKPGITFKNIK